MRKHLIALITLLTVLACFAGCAAPAKSQSDSEGTQASESAQPSENALPSESAQAPKSAQPSESAQPADTPIQASDIPADEEASVEFSAWNKDAASLAALVAYVEAVTDPNSPNFIKVEDRIATFDMDGTFVGELYPTYFEYNMLEYRALDDQRQETARPLRHEARLRGSQGLQRHDARPV